jgi:hypothetical protein
VILFGYGQVIIMNRKELAIKLENEGIRENDYSLYGAHFEGRYTLSQKPYGKWEIYYFERGAKLDLREFNNESDACESLLLRILDNTSTKE